MMDLSSILRVKTLNLRLLFSRKEGSAVARFSLGCSLFVGPTRRPLVEEQKVKVVKLVGDIEAAERTHHG